MKNRKCPIPLGLEKYCGTTDLTILQKKENNAHNCTVSAIQAAKSERRKKGTAGNRRAIRWTLQERMGERKKIRILWPMLPT